MKKKVSALKVEIKAKNLNFDRNQGSAILPGIVGRRVQ